MLRSTLWLALVLTLPACGAEVGPGGKPGAGGKADGADAASPELPDDATALLEIHALDIWGQPLPTAGTALEITSSGAPVTAHGFPVAQVALSRSSSYEIALAAADHRPLELQLLYDGSGAIDGLQYHGINDARHGLAIHREMRNIDPDLPAVPVYTVYLGARHAWFSAAGRPARRDNDVRLLMDGEQAWASVYDDLMSATHSVMLSTWWWESTFELVRDGTEHITMSDSDRYHNTILGVLEAIPATKRLIVAQFLSQDGLLDWATSDSAVRAHGETSGDDFELMGQANETSGLFRFDVEPFSFGDRVRAVYELDAAGFDADSDIESTVPGHDVNLNDWPIDIEVQHASYHQKFAVVDDVFLSVGSANKNNRGMIYEGEMNAAVFDAD